MESLLQKMTYGHYILTALKKGEEMKERNKDYLAAGTVNWASQVSFEPMQIVVAVGKFSDLNETIDYSGHFTLHLLSEHHKDLIEKFAGNNQVDGNKINGVEYRKEGDELILPDTLGYIKCKVEDTVETGDHRLYIGEVVETRELNDHKAICTMDVPLQYSPEKASI